MEVVRNNTRKTRNTQHATRNTQHATRNTRNTRNAYNTELVMMMRVSCCVCCLLVGVGCLLLLVRRTSPRSSSVLLCLRSTTCSSHRCKSAASLGLHFELEPLNSLTHYVHLFRYSYRRPRRTDTKQQGLRVEFRKICGFVIR